MDRDESERYVQLVNGVDRRELSIGPCPFNSHYEILPGDTWEAVDFLYRLVEKPEMIRRIRDLLTVYGEPVPDDSGADVVIEKVVGLLRRRELCLDRNPHERLPWPIPLPQIAPPAREPKPQPRVAKAGSSSSAPQDPVLDQDCQADTLKHASQSGTPFCEECEKQSQQKAA